MVHVLLLLLVFIVSTCKSDITIGDATLQATVHTSSCDEDFGKITSLKRLDEGIEVSETQNYVWSVTVVESGGPVQITSANINQSKVTCNVVSPSSKYLSLKWNDVRENLNLILNLTINEGVLAYELGFEKVSDTNPISIWEYTLVPLRAKISSDSKVFDNVGFGVVQNPGNISNAYPQSTLQFQGIIGSPTTTYVGVHDTNASSKTFQMSVNEKLTYLDFLISGILPDAGIPIRGQKMVNYPIVVKVLKSGSTWYDISMVYRDFVTHHAQWTKRGRLIDRETSLGSWINTLVWVNSHWQGQDIFNITGGDPSVVHNRMLSVKRRFDLPSDALALHYYEWDTLGYEYGSNYTKCESEITCGFDTHYPEYFPTRKGFVERLAEMQAQGIRVAPYINGRIFDQATKSWNVDSKSASAKQVPSPILITDPSRIDSETYNESYGSKAVFAVMCPHTTYWQEKIISIVQNLTHNFNTDGVYIDQIAAAGPRPCFDPSHDHPLGGGDHWVKGYSNMLDRIQQIAPKKMILTESNAEPFMSGVDIFLTLVGYLSGDLPGTKDSDQVMVPAFQSIYGGYITTMGAEFYQTDFENPDVFAAKTAAQFVFGSMLGWYSLGGRENANPKMGIYDLLMSPKYDDEIFYLKRLALARRAASHFMVYGRSGRDIELVVNGTTSLHNKFQTFSRDISNDEYVKISRAFPAVMSSTWISPSEDSLCVVLTTVKRSTWALVSSSINMTTFYMKHLNTDSEYGIFELPLDGGDPVQLEGRFSPEHVTFELPIGVRDARVLWIRAL